MTLIRDDLFLLFLVLHESSSLGKRIPFPFRRLQKSREYSFEKSMIDMMILISGVSCIYVSNTAIWALWITLS